MTVNVKVNGETLRVSDEYTAEEVVALICRASADGERVVMLDGFRGGAAFIGLGGAATITVHDRGDASVVL